MTVAHGEYDEHEGRDERAARDGAPGARHDGADALMLAVTDGPVPDAARADEEFMAEHAAAVADVAALRKQLRAMGDTLARGPEAEPPTARPVRAPGPAGPGWRRALLALAATAAAGLLGGVVWLGARADLGSGGDGDAKSADAGSRPGELESGGDTAQRDEGGKQSGVGYVACARLIVEGTVRSVETLPGGIEDRITLDVARAYKPVKAPDEVTFVMDVNVDPPLRAGDRALIGIPEGEASPDIWSTGKGVAEERGWIVAALPKARALESRGLEC
ncbi:hypothetical protein [Streptomyces spectabilis]|uniref:Uncharacterized protein n=2 Tax=Streptomyces spectabilis TaxID=68270 RepID=A0A7W8EZF5_STRST|nr:hypothetical protein [Streptomyces spectabilis]MBB5109109.1 hypothetical protein [Streptomyces spectabilis]MCI3902752.1 hypothetical protein [Streptomyces spectabilis]GGV44765.1 hypothetical protein GCM10010245_70070 [Streptomyces spectabilis]